VCVRRAALVGNGHNAIYVRDLCEQTDDVIVILITYAVVIMLITLVAARRWPSYDRARLTMAVSFPGPILLIVAAIGFLIYVDMPPRGSAEPDAGAMALVVIIAGAAVGATSMLVAGLASSWLSMKLFPPKP
jgi:hypothetical protein